MRFVERLITLIAPHSCTGCGNEGSLLCAACAAALPSVPSRCYRCSRLTTTFRTCPSCRSRSDLFAVYPLTVYNQTAKRLVYSLKFAWAQAAAADIAAAIAARGLVGGEWVISYVPTANARVRERGYDQAALIARQLAQLTGHPYAPLLTRRGGQRQVGAQRTTRQAQMKDAFRAVPQAALHQRVLLVDDVLTTGATCEAAARTLRQAGVKRVSAVVSAVA